MRPLYRPRWPLLLTLVLGVGAVIAWTALAREQPASEAEPTRGGVYVEGVAGVPSRINPLFATFNSVDADLSALIFSSLVRLGPKGGIEPDLAASWKVSPDGLTYVFQLRRGLYWHDGTPLDAEDVVFTVRLIQAPDFQGDPMLAELFREVEVSAPDPATVQFRLSEPFAPFLAQGATVGILPEHLLRGVDGPALAESPFNQRPIGSGPFRLVQLTGDRAVLEPFDSYHLGRPLLERLELRFYRDDAALLNALRDGEVDGALFRPGLTADDVQVLTNGPWTVRALHGTDLRLVYLNPSVEAFSDVRVRKALQHGLDRAALVDEVLAGQGVLLDSPLTPDLWAYEGEPEAYRFDPALAASLLDEAGWQLDDAGVRQRDGTALKVSLATSDDPLDVRVAEEIARQWRELGIDVEIVASGASGFVEDVLLPRAFEAALVTIDPGPDPDPYPFWHSSQALGEGRNLAGFSNEEADRLLENARQRASPAERAEAYRAFQRIFAEQVPAVLLYTPTYLYVVDQEVQDMAPGLLFDLSSRFHDVERWYIATEPTQDGEP